MSQMPAILLGLCLLIPHTANSRAFQAHNCQGNFQSVSGGICLQRLPLPVSLGWVFALHTPLPRTGPAVPNRAEVGRQMGWGNACTSCSHLRMSQVASAEAAIAQRRKKMMLCVRIRIMEDVVRRVNDPALSYHRKRETVEELESYLRRMRTLTAEVSETVETVGKIERVGERAAIDEECAARIEQTLAHMRDAKVIAVLRGKNPQRLIARGVDLAQCGCRCMEVTLDSPDALAVLRTLASRLPESVLLGAATVIRREQACDAIAAGAKFVTSPIAAVDLVHVCHQAGVVAIPAGLTPTEIYTNIEAGARAVKVFPASVLSAEGLKSILQLGPFQNTFIMSAGGVLPCDVTTWLEAGADAVALGTQLVGADIKLASSPQGGVQGVVGLQFHESELEWEEQGRERACRLFASLRPGADSL